MGKEDTVFDYKSAIPEAERVKKYFAAAGCPENFTFTAWDDGPHNIAIAGDIPQTGNTNTRVSFGCDICNFLTRWCEAGPTHHLALGIGHHMDTLRKYAKISGIELIEVK